MDNTLIQRKILFGDKEKSMVMLSPDAYYLSYLAPHNNSLNIWLAPLKEYKSAEPIIKDLLSNVHGFTWAYTNKHILYIQDKNGNEEYFINCLDINTKKIVNLTPIKNGVSAYFLSKRLKYPTKIIIRLNERSSNCYDLYEIDIITKRKKLILKDNNYSDFIIDNDLNLRFIVRMNKNGDREILRIVSKKNYLPVITIDKENDFNTYILGFDQSNSKIYFVDSRERNTSALKLLPIDDDNNPLNSKAIILAEDSKADLNNIVMHPTSLNVQAVSFYYLRENWQLIDKSLEDDWKRIQNINDGDFNIVSKSIDDYQWIIEYYNDNGPSYYYHYNRKIKKTNLLFSDNDNLLINNLSKMEPIIIKSRDNLDLVCYLSKPKIISQKGDKINKPMPMVLLVHGGPWDRDYWGFDPVHQWLTNRGYIALSVNYRGSVGFGKNFINIADKEWGGAMQCDLIDVVEWAIKKKITNPDKIAIMGVSYGGYAALAGLTFTPDLFACAIDIMGPSNLITFLESLPSYWESEKELFKKRIGDHTTKEGRELLKMRSPIEFANKIKKPLLICQGGNDPRVKKIESDQIAKKIKDRKIDMIYTFFPDEGHGFDKAENRLSFFAVAEFFLSKHLNGRFEPIKNDFCNSSIKFLAIDSKTYNSMMNYYPDKYKEL